MSSNKGDRFGLQVLLKGYLTDAQKTPAQVFSSTPPLFLTLAFKKLTAAGISPENNNIQKNNNTLNQLHYFNAHLISRNIQIQPINEKWQ